DTGQVKIQQRLLGGYTVAVPAFQRVVRVQQFSFQFGKSLLPMVFRRLVVGTPHSPSHVDGAQQGPVSRGRLPDSGFVEVDAGPGRNEVREIVDVVGRLQREGRQPGAGPEGVVDVVHLLLPVDDVATGFDTRIKRIGMFSAR